MRYFSLKHLFLIAALENIDFSYNIGRYLYFVEYALPTPPLGYCFVVFKYVSIIHLWTQVAWRKGCWENLKEYYYTIRKSITGDVSVAPCKVYLWHENHQVNAAYLSYLFDQKKIQFFFLHGHSLGTRVSCHSRHSSTPGTLALKALRYSKHLGTGHLRHFI